MSRAPICLFDKLIGARNELVDPRGELGAVGPTIAMVWDGRCYPANTSFPNVLVDDNRISMIDGDHSSMIDPPMMMIGR